jgi:hypothetical protein
MYTAPVLVRHGSHVLGLAQPVLRQSAPLPPVPVELSVHTGLPSFTTQGPFAQRTAAHASMQTGLPSSTWQVPPFGQATPLQASLPPQVLASGVVVRGVDPLVVLSSVPHPIPRPAASRKTKSILFIVGSLSRDDRRRLRGDVAGRLEPRRGMMFTRRKLPPLHRTLRESVAGCQKAEVRPSVRPSGRRPRAPRPRRSSRETGAG